MPKRVGPETSAIIDIDLPTSGPYCLGRDIQYEALDNAWIDGVKRIVSIVARGGEGKTTLVRQWLDQLASNAKFGAHRVFARSFYSQGTGDRIASADHVIQAALRFFGENAPERLSPYDRGVELARRIGAQRNLLILDGMEPLQHPPGPMGGEIKDSGLEALLTNLQYQPNGLCIVTTRQEIRPLQGAATHLEIALPRLPPAAARQLMNRLGVHGDDIEIDRAVDENEAHALAVTLLGTYLVERFDGDIAMFGRIVYPPGFDDGDTISSVELLKGGERESRHARKMIGSYVKWFEDEADVVNHAALVVLRLMGLFNRPPEAGCIKSLRSKPLKKLSESLFAGIDPEETWQRAILRLERAQLVIRRKSDWNEIDCHPLIREYFAADLAKNCVSAMREAHLRLFDHLRKSAPPLPENLKDMMPLFHAVMHGCKAGHCKLAHDEVYFPRIRRGHADFAVKQLGAASVELTMLSSFFLKPWTDPHPSLGRNHQLSIISVSGFLLRALGNFHESLELMKTSLDGRITARIWGDAAMDAVNLSEVCASLGEMSASLHHAEMSVELADRNKSSVPWVAAAMESASRAAVGVSLQLLGVPDKAAAAFNDAESCERRNVGRRYLRTTMGFSFCQFKLDELRRFKGSPNEFTIRINEVRARARSALEMPFGMEPTLTDVGLNNLTLGRTFLLESRALLNGDVNDMGREQKQYKMMHAADDHLCISLASLRQAGNQDDLPRILLSIAALRRMCCEICLRSQHELRDEMFNHHRRNAEDHLSQAETIAKRGPMLVWQIEVALERVRFCMALGNPENTIPIAKLCEADDWRDRALQGIAEVKNLIRKTERPFQAHARLWKGWNQPNYIGVFTNGQQLGYHCRNDEIQLLEKHLSQCEEKAR